MTDAQGTEHGLFSSFFNHADQCAEAYCVCGEYATGETLTRAEEALVDEHLAHIEQPRG